MRWIAGALSVIIFILLRLAVKTGKGMKYIRYARDVRRHKNYAWAALAFTIISVVFIEIMVRSSLFGNNPWEDYLFWIFHLPSAIAYLMLLLITIYKFNGERNLPAHRWLVYKIYYTYLLAGITGLLLLFPEAFTPVIYVWRIIEVLSN